VYEQRHPEGTRHAERGSTGSHGLRGKQEKYPRSLAPCGRGSR
jgi:hypothetical protein